MNEATERIKDMVDQVPRTADGVPVILPAVTAVWYPGDESAAIVTYHSSDEDVFAWRTSKKNCCPTCGRGSDVGHTPISRCYSTKALADAAFADS